jgi:hypothetical protein
LTLRPKLPSLILDGINRRQSTGRQHHDETFDLPFERIDTPINQIDLPSLTASTAVKTQPDRRQRLIAAYAVAGHAA